MPASPSFPSGDGRGKWKRRKREQQPTQISNKKQKHQEDPPEDDDEDDAVDEDNDQLHRDDSEGPTPNNNLLLHHQLPPDPTTHLESEVLSDAVRISDFPLVTKRDVNRPHPSVMAVVALERANSSGGSRGQQGQQVLNLENVSYGQLLVFSAVPPAVAQEAIAPVAPAPTPAAAAAGPSDQERSDGGNSAGPPYVITPPQIMEGKGVVKRFGSRVHVVPMHSDWFSPATVNRLERQVVPHFFSGKSPDHTPVKYMECRNYIVAKYMENPERRLLVSDCQGLVVGIANEDVARIFRFLDNWGIINYCAAPPVPEPWNGRFFLREEPTGEIRVPSDALKSIDSLIKFDKPKCRLRAADVYSSLYCHDDDLSDLDDRIRERLSENRCNHCSCVLPSAYYQSQKEADVLLCSECFHEGRFVIGHSSLDFVKVDSPKDYGDIDGENWTDQETLLLLEAMEMYNENWNEIAEHVGTKSKAQCILHFLRLPMEDSLLENIEVPKASKSSNPSNRDDHGRLNLSSNGELPGSDLQDSDTDSRLPFANSGNPVMALVAFLSHTVGPRVAAACAHASLAVLCEDNRMNSERLHGMEGSFHGEVRNSIQQKEGHQHGSRGQNEAQYTPLSAEKVKSAAKAGLAAAATKAKLFADHEEREIQRLSANVINQQFKRLELKLKQFAEVEGLLLRECEQAEKARQRFVAERARLLSTQVGQGRPGVVTSQMNLAGAAPSMVNSNNISNARPQMMPASSSQPSVSGYGNNQQVPPHMSFVQRGQPQQMFPLGPRLPLSAIQPSSSASSNAMFNPSGNSQPGPGLNQMLRSVSGSGPSSGLG